MKMRDSPAKELALDTEPRKGLKRYPFARLQGDGQKIQADSPVFCGGPGLAPQKMRPNS
jgi:hypothetical protein